MKVTEKKKSTNAFERVRVYIGEDTVREMLSSKMIFQVFFLFPLRQDGHRSQTALF